MTSSESRFVGARRALLVEGLLAAFEEVRNENTPRWISLEADSGWGKTRLVSEFYKRLAAAQPSPQYWPAALAPADVGLQERRKAISPSEVTHTPGSLPEWGWWGIRGERGQSGSESEALALSARQLLAHAPYYQLALKSSGWGKFLRSAGRATAEEGAEHVEDSIVDAVLGSFVPGYSLVKHLGRILGTQIKQSMEDTRAVAGTQLIFDESSFDSDNASSLASTVGQLASAGLPMVIVVEDLHLADGSLCALIEEVMAGSGPMLLITTAWQGLLDDRHATNSLMAVASPRLQRIGPSTESLWPCFPEGASLSALEPNDLSAILLQVFPEASDRLVAAVLAQYGNPLGVELLLSIARYRTSLSRLESDVDRLPSTLDDLYGAIWRELPERVRKFIAVATLATPARYQGDQLSLPATWNASLVLKSAQESELIDEVSAVDYLDYGWVTAARGLLRAFPEPQQLRLAVTELDLYWRDTDDEVQHFWALAAQRSVDVIVAYSGSSGGTSLDEALNAAWLIVALADVHVPLQPAHALEAVLFLINVPGQVGRGRDWRLRLRLVDLALSGVDPHSDDVFLLRAERVANLFYAWRIPQARSESAALIFDWQEKHPNQALPGAWELTDQILHFDPPKRRNDYFHEPTGDSKDEAVRLVKWTAHERSYRRSVLKRLNDLGRQHGPGSEEHLTQVYLEGHKFNSAAFSVFFMEQTLVQHDRYRVIADDSEFLYDVRHQLALALWEDGQLEEAIATNRNVLERHPGPADTFHTLIDFLEWRTDRGVPEDAVDLVESVLRGYSFEFCLGTLDADQRAFRLLSHLRIAGIDNRVRSDFIEGSDKLLDELLERASASGDSEIGRSVSFLYELYFVRRLLRTDMQADALQRFSALEMIEGAVTSACGACYHEFYKVLGEVDGIRKRI